MGEMRSHVAPPGQSSSTVQIFVQILSWPSGQKPAHRSTYCGSQSCTVSQGPYRPPGEPVVESSELVLVLVPVESSELVAGSELELVSELVLVLEPVESELVSELELVSPGRPGQAQERRGRRRAQRVDRITLLRSIGRSREIEIGEEGLDRLPLLRRQWWDGLCGPRGGLCGGIRGVPGGRGSRGEVGTGSTQPEVVWLGLEIGLGLGCDGRGGHTLTLRADDHPQHQGAGPGQRGPGDDLAGGRDGDAGDGGAGHTGKAAGIGLVAVTTSKADVPSTVQELRSRLLPSCKETPYLVL